MGAFTYRLVDEDGADLGQLVSTQRAWRPGERLISGRAGELEVVSVVPAERGDDVRAYVVVRTVAAA